MKREIQPAAEEDKTPVAHIAKLEAEWDADGIDPSFNGRIFIVELFNEADILKSESGKQTEVAGEVEVDVQADVHEGGESGDGKLGFFAGSLQQCSGQHGEIVTATGVNRCGACGSLSLAVIRVLRRCTQRCGQKHHRQWDEKFHSLISVFMRQR